MVTPIKYKSDAWLTARPQYLGASEIPAICGLGWATPEQIVQDKLHYEYYEDRPNTPTWWGHREEPHIIEAALWEMGKTDHQRFDGWTWTDTSLGIMASPDSVISPDCETPDALFGTACEPIQAKMTRPSSMREWEHGPPPGFVIQVTTEMMMLGPLCTKAHLAARIEGRPVRVWTVWRNDALAEAIGKISTRWWELYPEFDSYTWMRFVSEQLSGTGVLRPDNVTSNNDTKKIRDEDLGVYMEWLAAREAYGKAKAAKESADAALTALFGAADTLTRPDGTPLVARTWITRSELDKKQLGLDHPDLHKRYSYPNCYSTLRKVV